MIHEVVIRHWDLSSSSAFLLVLAVGARQQQAVTPTVRSGLKPHRRLPSYGALGAGRRCSCWEWSVGRECCSRW